MNFYRPFLIIAFLRDYYDIHVLEFDSQQITEPRSLVAVKDASTFILDLIRRALNICFSLFHYVYINRNITNLSTFMYTIVKVSLYSERGLDPSTALVRVSIDGGQNFLKELF